jgi:hypothetical protein
LTETPKIVRLADTYRKLLEIPARSKVDSFHLSVCVVSNIDYLLSWNMTHLGVITYTKIKEYNEICGLWTPILISPEA